MTYQEFSNRFKLQTESLSSKCQDKAYNRRSQNKMKNHMRLSLAIMAMILTVAAFAQDSTRFPVKIICHQGKSVTLLSLDSVFLKSDTKQNLKVYTNIYNVDSIFVIPDLLVGKYWLEFVVHDYCISRMPIVVCSKCKNEFVILPTRKNLNDKCRNFTFVEISPGYQGGWKSLSKDLEKSYTKKQKKLIRSSDFKVHFYVTAQKQVSNITFSKGLPEEIKALIAKGLIEVLNWEPAILNGRIVDGELSLENRNFL